MSALEEVKITVTATSDPAPPAKQWVIVPVFGGDHDGKPLPERYDDYQRARVRGYMAALDGGWEGFRIEVARG